MSNQVEQQAGRRKEELLAMSRASRNDEGDVFAQISGHKTAATVAFMMAGLPIIIYSIIFGHVMIVLALTIFIEAYYTSLFVTAYRITKANKYLAYSIMCAVFFILCAVMFVRMAMGLSIIPGL